MEKSMLLYKLQEFHTLEVYQVDMYKSQVKSLEEPHIKWAYERMVLREQEHVDFHAQELEKLASGPVKVISPMFAAAGFVTGKALDFLSLKDRYKLGIAVEKKAVEMYYEFNKAAADDSRLAELVKNLWYFLVDEECHQFWFKEHLAKLSAANG